jgi:hypothetical protein
MPGVKAVKLSQEIRKTIDKYGPTNILSMFEIGNSIVDKGRSLAQMLGPRHIKVVKKYGNKTYAGKYKKYVRVHKYRKRYAALGN